MPRPKPKLAPADDTQEAAGPALAEEDFEHLICRLSAEFERLHRQASCLACENAQLRAASGGGCGHFDRGGCPGPACCQEEAEPLRSKWSCAEAAVAAPVAWKDWEADAAQVSCSPAGLPAGSPRQSGVQRLTTPGGTGTAGGNMGLREQFRRLDVHGTGKLYPEDVVRLMNKHAKNVGYESAINLVRVFNGLEPIDFGNGDNLSSPALGEELAMSEHRGIDFETFQHLMSYEQSYDHLDSDTVKCISSFQEACQAESHIPKRYCSHVPEKQSHQVQSGHGAAFWLETLPTIVIIINTVMTGFSADFQEYDGFWDVLEHIFVGFYTLEFVLKVMLYTCGGYFRGPGCWWNIFDFICLVISLADVAVKLSVQLFVEDGNEPDLTGFLIIKVFRLARLARLVRTLRFKIFRELKLMVLGVFSGLRVLTWAIVLLVILIYVVGVALTSLVGKQEAEFNSVVASMFTLFRCWTEGCAAYDGTPLAERLRMEYGFIFVVFHILMTMFVTVGVFNLIMAIFIENVVTSQSSRKSKEMGEKSREIEIKLKSLLGNFIKKGTSAADRSSHSSLLERACREWHSTSEPEDPWDWQAKKGNKVDAEWDVLRDMNVTITRSAFKTWLHDEKFQQLLDEADIESGNHFELFDVLDADMGGELSTDELTHGLMKLRGPVTKADIVAVRLKVAYMASLLEAAVRAPERLTSPRRQGG